MSFIALSTKRTLYFYLKLIIHFFFIFYKTNLLQPCNR
nr:MAG TPA: hypothetical protein [Caudoviricetes sp.]